nr:MAG TPA: hypothetical protein [Caudoviricetes sp.]
MFYFDVPVRFARQAYIIITFIITLYTYILTLYNYILVVCLPHLPGDCPRSARPFTALRPLIGAEGSFKKKAPQEALLLLYI